MPSMINIMQVDETLGFYETFGPVFRSNARWSTRCPVLPGPAWSCPVHLFVGGKLRRFPVPELGNETTDMSKVHKVPKLEMTAEAG